MSAEPLKSSPTCPCGRAYRRRRYWRRWDRATCRNCGRVAEVTEAIGGMWRSASFGLPISTAEPGVQPMNIPCATCSYPASCLRSSEVNAGEPACDDCCGHDASDVVCVPLEDVDPEALKAFEEAET